MEIIPVIDVKGGIVVQAIGGHREQYQPLKSQLTDSVRPMDVARAMLKVTGSDKLYVADLDAIEHDREVDESIVELVIDIDAEVWLDAGESCWQGAKIILGSESSDGFVDVYGCNAFSIDLRDSQLIWNSPNMTSLELAHEVIYRGPQTLIVLDVVTVGKNEGPTTMKLCREIRHAFPHIQLWTGGGIRDWDDVRFLERVAGVDGVLVCTALHNGKIRYTQGG